MERGGKQRGRDKERNKQRREGVMRGGKYDIGERERWRGENEG